MRTSNELSTLYKSIDQKNISESAKETLKKIRLANKNFKGKDEDAQELFIEFFNKLKSSKPVAVKTTQEYKDALKKAQIERGRKMREGKGKPKEPKGEGNEVDANRPAKPFGWRMRGKHNYRKPTRDDISKGRAYYEGRVNRADVKRKKYPMLKRGGKLEVINLSDDDKLNYYIAKQDYINKKERTKEDRKFISDMLTTTHNGKKFYSLGYDTESRGTVFSLEEAKKNARIITDSDLGKKWDVIIKEVGGNFGDKDFTQKSYVVMTSPLFPNEMLREMRNTLKYEEGGYMAKGGKINYDLYENKSPEYIEGEIAHTERSGRQFRIMGDSESADDRKQHADKLWDILRAKKANKMADGGYMAEGGEIKTKLKDYKSKVEGYFPNIEPTKERSWYLLETPQNEKVSFILESRSIYSDVGSSFLVYDKNYKYLGSANVLNGFNNIKRLKITKADVKFEDGGYMAKGGEFPNAYLEKEELDYKINWLNQQIESDYNNGEVNESTERYEEELERLKKRKEIIMSYSQEYAKGGAIKNQYEGRTPDDIWNNLSKSQRGHFLYDHEQEIANYKGIGELSSLEIRDAYNSDWADLDEDIKNRFDNHTRVGQYAKGGTIKVGDKVRSTTFKGVEGKVISKKGDMLFIEKYNAIPNGDTQRDVLRISEVEKMAQGGEVGKSFKISEMNEKLDRMFPDSFGFSIGTFSNEGNKIRNSSALIANENDPFRGLKDTDIDAKLFFPQYKRVHDIRFRIYQGGENTYFYFNLESEKGDEYIGQFGFKDQGNVPSSYITRFIAFLMEQYGLPFEVNHSVMAKGGILKEDDFVWNALGKKLLVDKVTKDEYYLVGYGQPFASPFVKSKVDNYIKKGEWTLKPKEYAKGGTIGGMSTYVSARDIEEIKLTINGDAKTLKGSDLMDGVYVKKASLKAKFDAYEINNQLANINSDIIDKLKIQEDWGIIYTNDSIQKKMVEEFQKTKIDSIFKSLTKSQRKEVSEILTDENNHILRNYLALRGYNGEQEYNTYKNGYDNMPKGRKYYLSPYVITRVVTMAEGGEVFYTEKHKND